MKELERIARELCISDGHDPNAWSLERTELVGAFGRPVVHGEPVPQWSLYSHLVVESIRSLIRGFESQGSEASLERYALGVLKGSEFYTPNEPPDQGPPPRERQWRERYGLLPVSQK